MVELSESLESVVLLSEEVLEDEEEEEDEKSDEIRRLRFKSEVLVLTEESESEELFL
mgnify:CR=1 FL=1